MTTRRPFKKLLVATLFALGSSAVGGTVWAVLGTHYTHAGVIAATDVFRNEPGSMMVVVDRRGQSLFVHDGVFELGSRKPKGGGGGGTPDPGSPWGVCGGGTSLSCESAYFQRECKADGVEGVQTCAQWTCHCMGQEGGYTAQSSPVCNSCAPAGDVQTPAQTLPSF